MKKIFSSPILWAICIAVIAILPTKACLDGYEVKEWQIVDTFNNTKELKEWSAIHYDSMVPGGMINSYFLSINPKQKTYLMKTTCVNGKVNYYLSWYPEPKYDDSRPYGDCYYDKINW